MECRRELTLVAAEPFRCRPTTGLWQVAAGSTNRMVRQAIRANRRTFYGGRTVAKKKAAKKAAKKGAKKKGAKKKSKKAPVTRKA